MTDFQKILLDTIRMIKQENSDIFRYPVRMYGFLLDYHPELELEINEYKEAILSNASILLVEQIEKGTADIDKIYHEIQMDSCATQISSYLEVLFLLEEISEKFHEWKKKESFLEDKAYVINIVKDDSVRTADEWYQMAHMQKTNLGITNKQDYIAFLMKAAELGHLAAMHSLALYYIKGKYVEQDLNKGIQFLKQCAEQGDVYSKYEIFLYSQKYPGIIAHKDALDYLKEAADNALIDAQFQLAMAYYNNATDGDYTRAIVLFNECADKGDASALYQLALCYRYGHGTKQDLNKAMEYLKNAAKLGHNRAREIIGVE